LGFRTDTAYPALGTASNRKICAQCGTAPPTAPGPYRPPTTDHRPLILIYAKLSQLEPEATPRKSQLSRRPGDIVPVSDQGILDKPRFEISNRVLELHGMRVAREFELTRSANGRFLMSIASSGVDLQGSMTGSRCSPGSIDHFRGQILSRYPRVFRGVCRHSLHFIS